MAIVFYTLVAVILPIFVLYLYIRKKTQWTGSEHPPGPKPLPIFGNLFDIAAMDTIPHKAFLKLSKKYGDIIKLQSGMENLIVLGSHETGKEVFYNEKVIERPVSFDIVNLIYHGSLKGKGTIMNGTETYPELRKFTLKSLKDLGFGKTASEESILDESEHLMKELAKKAEENGGRVNLDKLFNCAALNVVWNLVARERFDYDDQKMNKLHDYLNKFMQFGKDYFGKPLGMFPFLRFIPPFKGIFERAKEGMKDCREFIQETVEEHKKNLDINNPQDYIDMFLVKLKEEGHKKHFNEEDLVICCLDLFLGGSETTSKTLLASIGLLLQNPDIQEKVYREIQEVLAGRTVVTMTDKPNLPYTEATLNEIWRISNLVPLSPPRMSTTPIEIKKQKIPSNTTFVYNIYACHMDPDYWKDPKTLRPERFLNAEGRFQPDERSNPFGMGRRKCLGETLARMENFIFFANLMYNFKFHCPMNMMPDLEPQVGFTMGPKPFETYITARSC